MQLKWLQECSRCLQDALRALQARLRNLQELSGCAQNDPKALQDAQDALKSAKKPPKQASGLEVVAVAVAVAVVVLGVGATARGYSLLFSKGIWPPGNAETDLLGGLGPPKSCFQFRERP